MINKDIEKNLYIEYNKIYNKILKSLKRKDKRLKAIAKSTVKESWNRNEKEIKICNLKKIQVQ